jgi:hypothetical protein
MDSIYFDNLMDVELWRPVAIFDFVQPSAAAFPELPWVVEFTTRLLWRLPGTLERHFQEPEMRRRATILPYALPAHAQLDTDKSILWE